MNVTIMDIYFFFYKISLLIFCGFTWLCISYVDRIHAREKTRHVGCLIHKVITESKYEFLKNIYEKTRYILLRPLCVISECITGFIEGIENCDPIIKIQYNLNEHLQPNETQTNIQELQPNETQTNIHELQPNETQTTPKSSQTTPKTQYNPSKKLFVDTRCENTQQILIDSPIKNSVNLNIDVQNMNNKKNIIFARRRHHN